MRNVVADASRFLDQQLVRLGELVKLAHQCTPDFVVSRLAWDETGEVLNIPGLGGQSTWQVMVARMRLIIGWLPVGSSTENSRILDWTLVLPPVVLRTPSARGTKFSPDFATASGISANAGDCVLRVVAS